jgi:hypothetical protein
MKLVNIKNIFEVPQLKFKNVHKSVPHQMPYERSGVASKEFILRACTIFHTIPSALHSIIAARSAPLI